MICSFLRGGGKARNRGRGRQREEGGETEREEGGEIVSLLSSPTITSLHMIYYREKVIHVSGLTFLLGLMIVLNVI